MTLSRQEEIIGVLWLIASFKAFGNGWEVIGWVCFAKAAFDIACALSCGIKEKVKEIPCG